MKFFLHISVAVCIMYHPEQNLHIKAKIIVMLVSNGIWMVKPDPDHTLVKKIQPRVKL